MSADDDFGCLSDETLQKHVRRELGLEEQKSVEEHLQLCQPCRDALLVIRMHIEQPDQVSYPDPPEATDADVVSDENLSRAMQMARGRSFSEGIKLFEPDGPMRPVTSR